MKLLTFALVLLALTVVTVAIDEGRLGGSRTRLRHALKKKNKSCEAATDSGCEVCVGEQGHSFFRQDYDCYYDNNKHECHSKKSDRTYPAWSKSKDECIKFAAAEFHKKHLATLVTKGAICVGKGTDKLKASETDYGFEFEVKWPDGQGEADVSMRCWTDESYKPLQGKKSGDKYKFMVDMDQEDSYIKADPENGVYRMTEKDQPTKILVDKITAGWTPEIHVIFPALEDTKIPKTHLDAFNKHLTDFWKAVFQGKPQKDIDNYKAKDGNNCVAKLKTATECEYEKVATGKMIIVSDTAKKGVVCMTHYAKGTFRAYPQLNIKTKLSNLISMIGLVYKNLETIGDASQKARVAIFKMFYDALKTKDKDGDDHDVETLIIYLITNNIFIRPGNSGPYKDGYYLFPKFNATKVIEHHNKVPLIAKTADAIKAVVDKNLTPDKKFFKYKSLGGADIQYPANKVLFAISDFKSNSANSMVSNQMVREPATQMFSDGSFLSEARVLGGIMEAKIEAKQDDVKLVPEIMDISLFRAAFPADSPSQKKSV